MSLKTPKRLGLGAGLMLAFGKPALTASIPRPSTSTSTSVQIPATAPLDLSPVINPDFPGLAFEQASFTRYAQDDAGNPNAFSANLMAAIYSRTGGKPNIRLGGTSPDYGRLFPDQPEPAVPVAEQDNYQDIGHTSIGPSYWSLTESFPDAVYIIQVPLATTNISEPVAWARSAVDALGVARIFSLQPGNEADLYSDTFTGAGGVPLHPPAYQGTLTNETYVGNWTAYVAAIREGVPEVVSEGRYFTAFDTAARFDDELAVGRYIFPVETCFGLGIDDGEVVKEVAAHYYQGQAGTAETLGSVLMNLTVTHAHLDLFRVRIDWLRRNKPEIRFVLSEVGNSLQPTNTYEYQARLGSALWQVDFYLYCMAIGVERINYQQIMHAGYDMWLPVASAGHPAQVFSNYYSQPFVADFIGSSGKTQVTQLPFDDDDNVAVYAAYEDGVAKRIAVINMNYWNQTSSTEARGGVRLEFQVPDDDVARLTTAHLNSPLGAGAAADSITYGGSQWTYESLGKEVKGVREDTEIVAVVGGVACVTVASSEAVLIWLE